MSDVMPDSPDHRWEPDDAEGYGRVNGRRWRCTDPAIPPTLRQELVNALMQARREVGVGKRAGDAARVENARRLVHAAKVALGERGPKWWLAMSERDVLLRARATLVSLLSIRGADKSVCPSDIARATCGEDWRLQLPRVRLLVYQLADSHQVRVMQKGVEVTRPVRGPIRIAQGDRFEELCTETRDSSC